MIHDRGPSPSEMGSINSSSSSSSMDMDDLPPRSSLRHLLNPDDSNHQDQEGHESFDSVEAMSNMARRKTGYNLFSSASGSRRSTTSPVLQYGKVIGIQSLSSGDGQPVWDHPATIGLLPSLPITSPASPLQRNITGKGASFISPGILAAENAIFDLADNVLESDQGIVGEKIPGAEGSEGVGPASYSFEDVSKTCRTYLLRVDTDGDTAYARWQTSETSALLNWVLGPNTKVRWDEFVRGDQSLYFEQAGQELFEGQRSKSSIRNKWDRMMNTYKHMVNFAEFSGIFDNPPSHGELKKLVHLAKRRGKDVGPLTTHIVQQWYLEGWFSLCYSRFGKTGQTVLGKQTEASKQLRFRTYDVPLPKPPKANCMTGASADIDRVYSTYRHKTPSPTDRFVMSSNSETGDKTAIPTATDKSPFHEIKTDRHTEAHHFERGGQTSFPGCQSGEYQREKLLLALELAQADDSELRNAARHRLEAEWRNKAFDSEPNREDRWLKLQIARVLLRVGSPQIKEESKKYLMSELELSS